MKETPVVSVCMITYGHEKYIREAIEGVLMQNCDFNLELIIANDFSPDNTDLVVQDILESHSKKSCIKYFNHEKNLGMIPNFISALNECSGAYIALCEGDDYWTDPLKLQKQVDFLRKEPQFVLCFHKVDILKEDGTIVADFITKVPKNHENIEDLAKMGNYIHTPSVVFKNVIKEFPSEFSLSPVADYFLYLLLAEKGKLKYMVETMAVYRYGVGIHSSNSRITLAKKSLVFFSCILSYLKDPEIKKYIFERQLIAIKDLERIIKEECDKTKISGKIKKIKSNLRKVLNKFSFSNE